ncbi:protein-glutamine gamma-glutamyltransferase 6-like [Pelodytes ibericus]
MGIQDKILPPLPLTIIEDNTDNLDLTGWMRRGIKQVDDLRENAKMKAFPKLMEDYGIPAKDCFKYLRLQSYCSLPAPALKIKKFSLEAASNMAEHRTDLYNHSNMIVRRGQDFSIKLHCNRPYQKEDLMEFIVATGADPQESDSTMAVFELSKSTKGDNWTAVLESCSSEDMKVTITSPVNAVIGAYKMNIYIKSIGKKKYFKAGNFILLFNPWAPDDVVYLDDENERQEYVLNDSGIIYFGLEEWISEQGWDFGQFEEGILDLCFMILDRSLQHQEDPALDCSRRYDPGYVGRVISAMVNSFHDEGVLEGKWTGRMWDGTDPQEWIGSVEILTMWQKGGFKPVKYGQCWVFAGVMCTVLRCLGIPTRVITNFASAHDKNANLSVENIYTSSGKKKSSDSLWNYHVWNESWFLRPDLGLAYGGWQVLDATPQEISGETYCCGPTSVHAVKEGDVHLNHDTIFVYSEVNADCNTWIYYDSDVKEKVYTDIKIVGKKISTKSVGGNERVEITENYKYPEGSKEERAVYLKATKELVTMGVFEEENKISGQNGKKTKRKRGHEETHQPAITGKFKLVSPPEFAEDVNLILILKNSSKKSETIKMKLSSSAIDYTGRPMAEIFKHKSSYTLQPLEDLEIPITIPANLYLDELTKDNLIDVAALCELKSKEKVLVRRVVAIARPPIEIKVLSYPVVNEPCELMIIFRNPLSVPLNDGILVFGGSGLVKKQIKRKVPKLEPKGNGSITLEITPYRSGTKQLVVDFTSKHFSPIKGFQDIMVNNIFEEEEETEDIIID